MMFFPNGTANTSRTAGVGAGAGAFVISDRVNNVVRIRVFGGSGTVQTHMLVPGKSGVSESHWDENLKHWRYR